MEVFNWYIVAGEGGRYCLNGDVCVVEMRQQQFVDEKRLGVSASIIAKKDAEFQAAYPAASRRQCVWVSQEILGATDEHTVVGRGRAFTLINMDAFFRLHEGRRERQQQLLKALLAKSLA